MRMKLVQLGALTSILSKFVSTAMHTTVPPIVASSTSTTLSASQENRIYGGLDADVDQYPFIASLRFDPDGKTFCGGTLVAPQYILTAGHCIKTGEGQMFASLGSEFSSGSGSKSAEQIKVVEGYRHPLYNNDNHLYDIGLLKLETTSTQKTASLCATDGSDNRVGTMATVLGWGLTEDRKSSLTLKEVDVRIISNAECNKGYRNRITEGMICAGNGNGKDSCSGDSGGPLLANDVLVGVVSWGGKCGARAGVYTRLTYVMDFINDILKGATGTDSILSENLSKTESLSKINRPRRPTSNDTPASDAVSSNPGLGSTSSSTGSAATSGRLAKQSKTTVTEIPAAQPPITGFPANILTDEVPAFGKGCLVRKR